jgi:hypothetical protein
MHRVRVLRLVAPPVHAPERGAKVVQLQSRRAARLERLHAQRKPTRPDAA